MIFKFLYAGKDAHLKKYTLSLSLYDWTQEWTDGCPFLQPPLSMPTNDDYTISVLQQVRPARPDRTVCLCVVNWIWRGCEPQKVKSKRGTIFGVCLSSLQSLIATTMQYNKILHIHEHII